jgi:nucleoside-diphosphate-sugar epimerase
MRRGARLDADVTIRASQILKLLLEAHMKRLEIDFEGRTVLITGAATGIGRVTALAFAAARATVVIGDVDPRAEATVSEIVAAGGKAAFQKTDVSDSAQVQALVARAVAASRARSSAPRRAVSADSAPTTICGSRLSS